MRALLLALAGHLGASGQPDPAIATEYRRACTRLLLMAVAAMLTCLVGCAVLWVAGLVALWYTPWLVTYLVVSGLVLLIASVVASLGVLAMARQARELRSALEADRADAEEFPRSAAMRLAMTVLPAVTMLWWRGRLARGVARPR